MPLGVPRARAHLRRAVVDGLYADSRPFVVIARNVSMNYLAIIANLAIGLLMLPFNVTHLGTATYGLWMLAASINSHFSLLDLGYGGAITKFVAHYRAHREAAALNEIAS